MDEVKDMFQVNVFGLVACTKAVLPYMVKRNEGHIINIASLAGKIATPKSSAYAATKNMGRYMLKPTYVAGQIVKSMQTKKREVNLPKWMGIGPKLYALFPGLFERVAGKSLS